MSKRFNGIPLSVLAGAVALSLVATPMIMGVGKALAVTEKAEAPVLRTSIAPVEVSLAQPEACNRKVRVIYSGYGAAPACGEAR